MPPAQISRKQANALGSARDMMALEDRPVRNRQTNRRLATASSAAAWARLRHGGAYFGRGHPVPVLSGPPQYTTPPGSGRGALVWKTFSVRTHLWPHCGLLRARDHTAALLTGEVGLARASQG